MKVPLKLAKPRSAVPPRKIFDYQNYKLWILDLVARMPRQGRGELGRMAQALRIHSSHLSQVLRGARELTYEQGCELCHYLNLRPLEQSYFLALLQRARAGTPTSQAIAEQALRELREKAVQVQSRVGSATRTLDEFQSARFYSSWIYSAIRMASSLECPDGGAMRVSDLARRLHLPEARVREALDFLVGQGLCLSSEGRIEMGVAQTHVPQESLWAERHHLNWRLKASQWLSQERSGADLVFTAPVSLSQKDLIEVKKTLLTAVEKISARVRDSKPETLAVLNIDWMEFPKREK